jgi:hypothetical protein
LKRDEGNKPLLGTVGDDTIGADISHGNEARRCTDGTKDTYL